MNDPTHRFAEVRYDALPQLPPAENGDKLSTSRINWMLAGGTAGKSHIREAADRLARVFDRVAARVPRALRDTRWLLVVGLLFHGLADGSRVAGGLDAGMRRVFVSQLVDQIEAVLATPASPATRSALREGSGTRADTP